MSPSADKITSCFLSRIIVDLLKICKPEVFGMVECYGKGNDAVIECANCVYAGLQSEDENADCSQIEADTATAYGTCSEACDSSCDEETNQLLSCGGPVFCSGALARQDKDDAQLDNKWMFQHEGAHIDDLQDAAFESDLTESDHFDSTTSSDMSRDYNAKSENFDEVDEADEESLSNCRSGRVVLYCSHCCEGNKCLKLRRWGSFIFYFCLPQPTARPTTSPPTAEKIQLEPHHQPLHRMRPSPSSMVVAAPVLDVDE